MYVPEGGQPDRPAILVLSCGLGPIENAVLAGIEEEGVPYVIERTDGTEDADGLAHRAAHRSSLSVGVGIDCHGCVSVHHEQLAEPLSGLSSSTAADPMSARMLGHNAARIVVGIPLRGVR